MPHNVSILGNELWKHSFDELTPLCQVCPPFNAQLLCYCQFVDHLDLHPIKCDCRGCETKQKDYLRRLANTATCKKRKRSGSIGTKSPPIKKRQAATKVKMQRIKVTTINTALPYKRGTFTYISDMRFHHDNGVKDSKTKKASCLDF